MKIASRFWALFDRVNNVMAGCGMAVLGFILLAVCWEVVTRYFLGKGTIWVEEIGEYSMLFMTFLAAAWLLRMDGHVEMDIVVTRFSQQTQLLVRVVASWVGAAICMVMTYSGADVAFDHLQRGLHQPTPVEPPDFPLFAVIPLGFLMLSIQFIRRGYAAFVTWKASSTGTPKTTASSP
jgi:TRAP-type C4-dicarboxylate transport system permease small subunit